MLPRRRVRLFIWLIEVLILALAGVVLSWPVPIARASSRNDCAGPHADQHVYDCAGLLTAGEIADLEMRAAQVEQAGAPIAVYLQMREATYEEKVRDAADLMRR